MHTYWHLLNVGIQNTLVYRVNFLVRAVFNLVPLIAIIALWQAIYAGKSGDVSGYTLAGMISYYLLVTLIEAMTAVTEDDWQIAADIKDGHISQFLTRPLDYLHYRFCLFVAGRAVYTLAAAAPVGLFLCWHHQYLLPPASAAALGVFLVSLILSAVLQFLLSCLVAMLAFWVIEISTFVFILLAFERMASGQMFPLDILPGWVADVLHWTPFPYTMFFPAGVYLGKVTGPALLHGLLLQACWVIAIHGLVRWVWQQGLRKCTVVGG
jgi:ABC-2 type transport system permease protein